MSRKAEKVFSYSQGHSVLSPQQTLAPPHTIVGVTFILALPALHDCHKNMCSRNAIENLCHDIARPMIFKHSGVLTLL